jgi:hypothetical protein
LIVALNRSFLKLVKATIEKLICLPPDPSFVPVPVPVVVPVSLRIQPVIPPAINKDSKRSQKSVR